MRQYFCLFFVVVFKSGMGIYAQDWTKQDSLWLQRVLNGTEKIQLNEKTRKAIESGTFLHDPTITKQLKTSPIEMPIIKSFEGVTKPETRKINRMSPTELPASVYKLTILDPVDTIPHTRIFKIPDGSTATTFSDNTIKELKMLEAFTPKKATVDDKYSPPSGAAFKSDFEDVLRSIFWPSHRAKKRNAKSANAWKTYNDGY